MKNKRLIACLLAVLFLLPMIPVNLAYAEPAWSSDFQSFVLNQEYFQTGLNFNSDAYYQTRFTLYDFERDGEPELLVFNGGPSLAQMTVYVFQHTCFEICYGSSRPREPKLTKSASRSSISWLAFSPEFLSMNVKSA